jgi:hypothetical protein
MAVRPGRESGPRQHPEDNFAWVETQARGDVEFQIGMMHAMQAPEHGHGVKHDMLTIDDEIEEKHGGGDRDPRGQGDEIEQAPAMGLGQRQQLGLQSLAPFSIHEPGSAIGLQAAGRGRRGGGCRKNRGTTPCIACRTGD